MDQRAHRRGNDVDLAQDRADSHNVRVYGDPREGALLRGADVGGDRIAGRFVRQLPEQVCPQFCGRRSSL